MLQGFSRFIEIGRVAYVNYGPYKGKDVIIVDILNTTRALIDGPKNGVRRQEISLKRLTLTDFKLDIHRGIHKDALIKAIDSFGLENKLKETSYAKKIARREKRASLNDFERYKVMRLRQKRTQIRAKAIGKK